MSHGDQLSKCPDNFQVIARTDSAPFAAIAHTSKPIFGIQFHAESILTQHGYDLLHDLVRDLLLD